MFGGRGVWWKGGGGRAVRADFNSSIPLIVFSSCVGTPLSKRTSPTNCRRWPTRRLPFCPSAREASAPPSRSPRARPPTCDLAWAVGMCQRLAMRPPCVGWVLVTDVACSPETPYASIVLYSNNLSNCCQNVWGHSSVLPPLCSDEHIVQLAKQDLGRAALRGRTGE